MKNGAPLGTSSVIRPATRAATQGQSRAWPNLFGDITDGPVASLRLEGEVPIRTSAAEWARIIANLAHEAGFDTFVYWLETADETQLLCWTRDVIPAAHELLS